LVVNHWFIVTKLLINLKVNYTIENTYERVIHN